MKPIPSPAIILPIPKELGKQIRALRQQKAWSQSAMARFCGIHLSHLSKIERGRGNVTLFTLVSIARPLGVILNNLLRVA
jgi:transcriptional regulator with XRE-family HTH domain